MGKKVKKKARSFQKEKRVVTPSPKTASEQCNASVETAVGAASVVKGKASCTHLDRGVDLSKTLEKLRSSKPKCEGCREVANDRRGNKGKGKQGKKKKGAGSGDSKSETTKAIWVCLSCGRYLCGGVGFPTTPKSHAVRHAKLNHHPLAIQFGNPNLRWCFPCNTLVPIEKTEENGEQKNMLSDIVKIIKGRSLAGESVNVEDVWFGSGSIVNERKSENTKSSGFAGQGGGYVVRGLSNLGNTCFFNSVMQNLLSLDSFRDHFLKFDASVGPLTAALKKLIIETISEGGLRNVMNPRSVFGCLCAKAPQFRGYQQHDSHELLRCLLDGLCAEELSMQKAIKSSQTDGNFRNQDSTFVDDLFGGRTSSTVCCLECGHSSTVLEPFLDLSVPVPTKRPASKKAQSASRAKKMKLPPKRGGRVCAKLNKDKDAASTQIPYSSDGATGSENPVACSGDSTLLDTMGPVSVGDSKDPARHNSVADHEADTKQVSENGVEKTSTSSDASELATWLDYLEPETISDCQNENVLEVQDFQNKDSINNSESNLDSTSLVCMEQNLKSESSENLWKEEVPEQVKDSEVLLLPYKEETPIAAELMVGEGDTSFVVSCEQDSFDYEGLGGLFDEPEVAESPSENPLSGANNFQADKRAGAGLIAGNSSESDPDEVDNTDSPVSVESCLAYFTKPELLSNAWLCENCLTILREQRMESRKDKLKIECTDSVKGGKDGVHNKSLSLNKNSPHPTEVRSLDNVDFLSDAVLSRSLESQNGDALDSAHNCAELETSQIGEQKSVIPANESNPEPSHSSSCYRTCSEASFSNQSNEVHTTNESDPESSHSSSCHRTCSEASFSNQSNEVHTANESSRNARCKNGRLNPKGSQLSAGPSKLGENEVDDVDSESVKVKRDATKRILINKAPPILTIHLKRFSQDARGRLSKLNGHVEFGDKIDLRPYMDPRHMESDHGYDYRLIGIVEHLGNMRGGHYVAYVRSGKRRKCEADEENGGSVWYHISDAYVREASPEAVFHCEAYILFYEKV